LAAIDRKRALRVDGREGRKPVEITRAIYQSARTGKVVKLPLVESRQWAVTAGAGAQGAPYIGVDP